MIKRICAVGMIILIGAWCLAVSVSAQSTADENQLKSLVQGFIEQQKYGGDTSTLLSPRLSGEERLHQAEKIAGPYSEYEIYEYGRFSINGNCAELSAKLHSRTPSTDFNKPVRLSFEKVEGAWYFATYQNLGFPKLLVTLVVLIAIVYAIVSLLFYRHVTLQTFPKRILWESLVLTPIGWLLYPSRKPWKAS